MIRKFFTNMIAIREAQVRMEVARRLQGEYPNETVEHIAQKLEDGALFQ